MTLPSLRRRLALFLVLTTLFIATWASAAPTSQTATALSPEQRYGLWTLTPAVVAIAAAMLLRQVLPALLLSILTASVMTMFILPPAEAFGGPSILSAVRLAVERYIVGGLTDPRHTGIVDSTRIQTIVASLVISGMIGVIHGNGGTSALVRKIAVFATNRRRGQLTATAAGGLMFFDDYLSCLIVGPTMRPMLDRVRVSREKLAFIVNALAVMLASIAPCGTWITTELAVIQAGFDQMHGESLPAFLRGKTAYQTFFLSMPYRFYTLFMIALVLLVAILGRDFGPMRKAEQRVADRPDDEEKDSRVNENGAQWWHAAVPLAILVVTSLGILFATGWLASESPRTIDRIFEHANAYHAILYSAFISLILAIAISLVTRRQNLSAAMDSMTDGLKRVLSALVILVLAWALSDGMKDLHLGQAAVATLKAYQFSPQLLPLLIFVCACIVSFATGTSYGTMGILGPVAIVLAGHLAADLPQEQALTLFYGTVGSVLAGAVFGDQCSPISGTVVLSSLSTNCKIEAHVWTQLPYGLAAVAMAILAGNLLSGWYGISVWIGLIAGLAGLASLLLILGRRPSTATGALV